MKKKYVVFDIDGTLSTPNPERMKFAHKDWDAFYACSFDDEPIQPMVDLADLTSCKHLIIYCTARSERVREETYLWLVSQNLPYPHNLLMRPDGDERSAVEVKLSLLKDYLGNIELMFDDHNEIVRVFRSLGIIVLQPQNYDK